MAKATQTTSKVEVETQATSTKTLERFVSAQWIEPEAPGEPRRIKAIGDDGREYIIPSETSDTPPWPDYLRNGGSITTAAKDPTNDILGAPEDLTGGPTLGEVYDGNT